MSTRTPSLEETIRRRQRTPLPRAPERTLGEKIRKARDLETIMEELAEEAKNLTWLLQEARQETLFTMTLERHRLMSALNYAGFLGSIFYNYEGQIGPGATLTTYLPVPAGWVFSPLRASYYNSLPWWLTVTIWIDSDLPAIPNVFLTRAPDRYDHIFEGLNWMTQFMRFTVTNNHAVNTANYLAIQGFDFMREEVWRMIEEIYLKPIAEYAQKKAEELTGRPFP